MVFDTTCLSAFALADRIDVLGNLLVGRRCLTTTVVLNELQRGVPDRPELLAVGEQEWLIAEAIDGFERVIEFVRWAKRMGGNPDRNHGEASVMVIAEELGATAIIDDRAAKQVAAEHYPRVHGTLWLLSELQYSGKMTEAEACAMVDMLVGTGMRLPCSGSGFPAFAKQLRLGDRSRK
ncbi:hypothetical protein [Glycomyces terrestris]|uniref:Nucleic acid-binding protein n=1 Tax=Glycomyces terrestris TaxID=2493553 RepID=A0A426V0A1_9ACTN|nr:hypothetical protein [Glycomyces terrestris]RRS00273.1 hypothetical protein EIW28_06715 [Glycomyces terrestris]